MAIAIFLIVTLPVIFITLPIVIVYYNKLNKTKNRVKFAFSGMDVQLKKRADMIPNLVASVKSIMTHETELFSNITALRSKILDANPNSKERFEAESQLSGLMGNLNISMESYPEMKSNDNMMHLQRSITDVEEQISASRRAYNSTVLNMNDSITTFPGNIFGAAMELNEDEYFQVADGDRANPNVSNLFGV